MTDTISTKVIAEKIAKYERLSDAENAAADALEYEARQKRQSAATYALMAKEFQSVLENPSYRQAERESVAAGLPQKEQSERSPIRYRNEGATVDLVRLILASNGVDEEEAIAYLKEKQNIVRDTAKKLIKRMTENNDAVCLDGRLYFTESGRRVWQASPLSKKNLEIVRAASSAN